MIRHHPSDELLLQAAAGELPAGAAVVVAAHAERCASCQSTWRAFEAIGGAVLEDLPPTALAGDALAHTFARLDAPAPSAPSDEIPPADRMHASLPAGLTWPRGLHAAHTTRWRHLGVGLRWCRVRLAGAPEANVFLLRVAPGKGLPVHGHRGGELTQVLYGAFDDGRTRYAAGDFEQANGSVHHRPIVAAGGECVCLIAVEGRMSFDGPLARAVGSLLGV